MAKIEHATATERLAQFALDLRLNDVPPAVLHAAKQSIIDTLGVMIAGARQPLARTIADFAGEMHGKGACTALALEPLRLTPGGAALANGAAAHVLDFDDTTFEGLAHASAVVMAGALAAAEAERASGGELLLSFIAGVEAISALGRALSNGIYFRGVWTTANFGVVGSAVAAARLLKLDRNEAAAAVGIAAAQAFGTHEVFGTHAKPFLCGRAAQVGLESAVAARKGLRGPRAMLEGASGIAHVINGGELNAAELDKLGGYWSLTGGAFGRKMFPCCSSGQAGAEAAQILMKRHELRAAGIASIEVAATPLVNHCLVYAMPATVSEAQFSMSFPVACIVLNGDFRVEHLDLDLIRSPQMRSMMSRVKLVEDAALAVTEQQRRDQPEGARVTIVTSDGRELSLHLGAGTGMPVNPMTDAQIDAKFMACVTPSLGPAKAIELLRRLQRFEAIESATGIFDCVL